MTHDPQQHAFLGRKKCRSHFMQLPGAEMPPSLHVPPGAENAALNEATCPMRNVGDVRKVGNAAWISVVHWQMLETE